MHVNQSKIKFEQADQYLEAAQSELYRPVEDVVPYMVCRSARHAISHYLQGYLLKHGIESTEGASLKNLLEKCRTIESTFNSLDLSPITFNRDDEYSAEFHEMKNCIELATVVKQLVRKTGPVSENKSMK